jgi:hypothetical protein
MGVNTQENAKSDASRGDRTAGLERRDHRLAINRRKSSERAVLVSVSFLNLMMSSWRIAVSPFDALTMESEGTAARARCEAPRSYAPLHQRSRLLLCLGNGDPLHLGRDWSFQHVVLLFTQPRPYRGSMRVGRFLILEPERHPFCDRAHRFHSFSWPYEVVIT